MNAPSEQAHDHPQDVTDTTAHETSHAHHEMHTAHDHAAAHSSDYRASELLKPEPDQTAHMTHDAHAGHEGHDGHGVMHEGHETMMRNRFFVTLPLTLIVLVFSPLIQSWFG